jgi:hypothetical protein
MRAAAALEDAQHTQDGAEEVGVEGGGRMWRRRMHSTHRVWVICGVE